MTEALRIISNEHRGMWRLATALDVLRKNLEEQGDRPDAELFGLIFDYFETYIDRVHQPKEEEYLYKAVRSRSQKANAVLAVLERDHKTGGGHLTNLRAGLERLSRDFPSGREEFLAELRAFIDMMRFHIRKEESQVFSVAREVLSEEDWKSINEAFANNDDPLFGENARAEFRALLSRIVNMAPEPIGLGLEHHDNPPPGAPLLEIEGLTSHYGRIQALRGVNIKVAQGQLVALVGANGAGKTTLLRTISGVQKATGGRILMNGEDITRMRADRRVRLGICQVPEGRQVFGPLSVEDNLRLGAYTRTDTQEVMADMERMYAMFPILKQKAKQAAGTLSGGQQQMLAIGRALMGRPKLLLLDEPSMGLAPLLVEEIFNAIINLREQGITIFLVEQNAHAALAIADYGYVLETGETVLEGHGRDLLENEQVKQAYLGM